MGLQLGEKYWDLPSIRLFIDRAINSLRDHKSVIIILPPLIDTDEFCEKFDNEIWKSELTRHDVSLDEADCNRKPIEILNQEFFPEHSNRFPKPLSEIQVREELPDLIMLQYLHKLPKTQLRDWITLMDNWSELAHQNINAGKAVKPIVAVVSAELVLDILPQSNLFLDYYWWWGFPSSLEVNFLFRSQATYFSNDPSNIWKEKLLCSLAPGDIKLLEHLWDLSAKNFTDLINAIKSYPHPNRANSSPSKLPNKLGHITDLPSFFPGAAPPKSVQQLWGKGDIYATIEYGIEFHPLVLLDRNTEAIRHRLWRSQGELLLPMIDSLRIDMCQELTQKFGADWPYRWATPEDPEDEKSVKENPAAAQLGYIVYLIETNPKFVNYRKWLPIARTAKNIRNNLAHYRTIDNFESLTSFMNSVMKRNEEI